MGIQQYSNQRRRRMEGCLPNTRRAIRADGDVLRTHKLHKLEQNDLYLKPEKCDFEQKQIDYLGVIVGNGQIQMDPKKLKGIADWPIPHNPTEIRKFLGFTGYYRYFVQGYSKIARPLLDLTKK